jgi:hypothetical protein
VGRVEPGPLVRGQLKIHGREALVELGHRGGALNSGVTLGR